MAAYLIADLDVTDPDGFARYRADVEPVIAQYGGRYLVRGGDIRPLEGEFGFHRVVVVEFPSMQAARRFYDSAEYAPLLKLRLDSTRSKVALVEGCDAG